MARDRLIAPLLPTTWRPPIPHCGFVELRRRVDFEKSPISANICFTPSARHPHQQIRNRLCHCRFRWSASRMARCRKRARSSLAPPCDRRLDGRQRCTRPEVIGWKPRPSFRFPSAAGRCRTVWSAAPCGLDLRSWPGSLPSCELGGLTCRRSIPAASKCSKSLSRAKSIVFAVSGRGAMPQRGAIRDGRNVPGMFVLIKGSVRVTRRDPFGHSAPILEQGPVNSLPKWTIIRPASVRRRPRDR